MKFNSLRKSLRFIVLFLAMHLSQAVHGQYIITTVAGSTNYGDGGAATSARIFNPLGMAIDNAGNIYVVDNSHYCVRKITPSGIITTVAGNGVSGTSPDGVTATAASLFYPYAVASDVIGNILIADRNAGTIRIVNSAGIIGTIDFPGLGLPQGIVLDDTGNIYVSDYEYGCVWKRNTSGFVTMVAGDGTLGYSGDGGPATAAQLSNPSGLAIDGSGNIFVADADNNRIREISASGIITTVAGNGSWGGYTADGFDATATQIYSPTSVAIDYLGQLVIVEAGNSLIRVVDASGIVYTLAGTPGTVGFSGDGGLADTARLYSPFAVVTDWLGNVFISDESNNRIRKVSYSGYISTIAGNGTSNFYGDGGAATAALIYQPIGVKADGNGNLFIADQGNNSIRKVNNLGIISTVVGCNSSGFTGDGGPATSARLSLPQSVTTTAGGNIFVSDYIYSRIREVNTFGIINTIAGGGLVFGDGGQATAAQLDFPTDVAVDGVGNIFVSDGSHYRIRKITASGIISTVAGSDSAGYSGDGGPATAARLNRTGGIAIDVSDNICIVDAMNHRIRKVSPSGIISTFVGTGIDGYSGDGGPATAAEVNDLYYITIDRYGNFYFGDGRAIRKVDTSGIISTIAGGGLNYPGDGGAATAAHLGIVSGISVDSSGNIFFADWWDNRIRKLSPCNMPLITSVSGTSTVCSGTSITLSDATSGGIWSSSNALIATVSSSGSVFGLSVGVDTIWYSVNNTCGTTKVIKILTVNSVPTAVPISGQINTCVGSSITLTDTAMGGTWSSAVPSIATITSSGVVTGVSTGVDTIHYLLTNTCGSTTIARVVTIHVPPNPGVISGTAVVCEGSTVTLSDSVAGGTWSSGSFGLATVGSTGSVHGIVAGVAIIS